MRLLPYVDADGATNMASDEAMVRTAADGVASLRFYGWTTATVSLGYFQPHAIRLTASLAGRASDGMLDPSLARPANDLSNLPWVRRPSGGATLVHHHELTYALAVPAGAPWHSGESWLLRMHRIIVAALDSLGLVGKIELVGQHPIKNDDVLCFQQHTVGDVLCAGCKIVGSAQRKHRLALMQHGSILLAQSEHTPALPGIRETAGVTLNSEQVQSGVERAFTGQTGWRLERGVWTEQELQSIEELRREKYAGAAWNERR